MYNTCTSSFSNFLSVLFFFKFETYGSQTGSVMNTSVIYVMRDRSKEDIGYERRSRARCSN